MPLSSSNIFTHTEAELQYLAQQTLDIALKSGASAAEVSLGESTGLMVDIRHGEVETVEQNQSRALQITVYLGARSAASSTSDLSIDAIKAAVQSACDIARYTAEDPFSGLPAVEDLATEWQDLDLFHPWDIDATKAADIARRIEQAALKTSPLITNAEGNSVSIEYSLHAFANSLGFSGVYPSSNHWLSAAPIAGNGGGMQRDSWYSSNRNPHNLSNPEQLGRYAAERALARLGAKSLSTRRCPVLFEAPLACGLLGAFSQAISGNAVYRRTSFLSDKMGEQVLADHIDIVDDPFILGALGSSPFDNEGVKVSRRSLVEGGYLQGWLLSSYSARKLGLRTTGNAGGSHNLQLSSRLTHPQDSFEAMLKKLGTGLLVTELIGQGVNYVTGDYSRGAFGYWVENGKIQYPVQEITIAGNLRDMFKNIEAIGSDILIRGGKSSGSLLISNMSVAGQ